VKGLAATSHKLRFAATAARPTRARFIRGVGIETLFDGLGGQLQNPLSGRHFQSLKIHIFHRLAPQQRFNLLNDVVGQQIGEEVFFLVSVVETVCACRSLAEQICSLTSINSRTN